MIMELELIYNEETQEWEQKPEPFIKIECETEEDFEFIGTAVAFYKKHLEEQEKPQTNADRIRAMSDEELYIWARKQIGCGFDFFPCGIVCEGKCESYSDEECKLKIMNWLKQPAEGELI
jgi:hypothetical protein